MKEKRDLLIIDDDLEILSILSTMVGDSGFSSIAAGGVDEAKQQLEKYQFSAILCDMRMPRSTGTQFLASLRMSNNPIPVIFLSAVSDTERVIEAMRYGALDYFFKPFKKDELLPAIRKAIDLGRCAE